ncbi:MAG: type II secretion system F family protein, partial [Isosphaeraceae bacterium]
MTRGLPNFHDRQRSPEIRANDLESLNNLLASLLQAGLPLESGLRAVAREWPGRAGSVLRQINERLSQGESLDSALNQFS